MVEDLMKGCLPRKQNAKKISGNRQLVRPSASASKSNCRSNLAKTGLRNFINKRISSENTESKSQNKSSQSTSELEIESTEDFSGTRCEEYAGDRNHEGNGENLAFMQISHFEDKVVNKELHLTIPQQSYNPQTQNMGESSQLPSSAELSLDQCNLLLDLLGTDNLTILQTEPDSASSSLPPPSQSEDRRTSSTLSPLSVTTNMLEELLKKTVGSSSSSESHSLENSTD
jgi:hypothetical protein